MIGAGADPQNGPYRDGQRDAIVEVDMQGKVFGDVLPMTNSAFRASRYAAEHPALVAGRRTAAARVAGRGDLRIARDHPRPLVSAKRPRIGTAWARRIGVPPLLAGGGTLIVETFSSLLLQSVLN